jgi:hypothetical protein
MCPGGSLLLDGGEVAHQGVHNGLRLSQMGSGVLALLGGGRLDGSEGHGKGRVGCNHVVLVRWGEGGKQQWQPGRRRWRLRKAGRRQ